MKNKRKSRSGCRKCKEKRLKCDEAQPGCANCKRRGLTCPGYQQRLQWSTKYERRPSAVPDGPRNFGQLASAVSQSISQGSPTDKLRAGSGGTPRTVTSTSFSVVESPSRRSPDSSDGTLPTSEPVTEESGGETEHVGTAARPDVASSMVLTQSVVDIPTFLINHWFKSVCPSWSAYDSDSNPYRRLTSSLWSTSMPVYWALQAISAASLVERLPHVMRETAMSAPRMAAQAIKKEMIAVAASGTGDRFPSELLLSLFCMSSSLCWMEARELGVHFVRQARAVLDFLNRKPVFGEDQELLDFFNGCLIYEEMLRSVVSDDETESRNLLRSSELVSPNSLMRLDPHAWTGVSPYMLRLFGKAMILCRRSRSRWRRHDSTTYKAIQGAMEDIEEARSLEELLLAAEIPVSWAQSVAQARDFDPLCLRDVTEAYRLSSLLQLYLTFPDLVANRIPSQVEQDGSVAWDAWVSPLALHISRILERVPPNSVRCIQPLLCLCAGSGLRLDKKTVPNQDLNNRPLILEQDPLATLSGIPPAVTEDIEISSNVYRARLLLMERLEQLEFSLPPKPICVAKQLLRAVWAAYDEEIGTAGRTHWIDVMTSTGLHSLFG